MVITHLETEVAKFVAGAIAVSGVTQTLKHFFFSKLSAPALVSVTTAVSALAVFANNFFSQVKIPEGDFTGQTVTVLGAATLAYRWLVGPFYQMLLDAKSYRNTPASANATTTPEAGF